MLGRFVDGTEGLTEAGWLVRSRIPLVYVAGIMDDGFFRAVRIGGWRHRPFYLGGCRGVETPASAEGVSREDCVTQDKNRYFFFSI